MKRTAIMAAVCALVVLTGCDDGNEPSPPPTSEDALTTATVAPPAADDEEVTSEAPADDQATSEDAAKTEAGPPTMPKEATERTEAGAEAFVDGYMEKFNWAYKTGDKSDLKNLSAPTCTSCEALLQDVDPSGLGEDYVDHSGLKGELLGDSARVLATVEQLAGDNAETATLVFNLRASEPNGWIVEEITVRERR